VVPVGNRRYRRDRRGSVADPATFLLLYMVRPGVSEALARPDEQGNSGRAPQLQVPVTTYSVAVEPREKVAHAVAGH
jgi:hypothetical protein